MKKKKQIIKKQLKKTDGWGNVYTQVMQNGKDKRTGSTITYSILNQLDVETLYAGDNIASKIIDTIPEEGIREWISFDNLKPKDSENLQNYLDNLKTKEKFEKAWKYGRLYGGAMILVSLSDGLELDEPVDFTKINSINALTVLSRYSITPETTEIDKDLQSKNYGMPIYYTLSNEGKGRIHHSRLLRFDGATLPEQIFRDNLYWHDSILSKIWRELEGYSNSHNALPNIVTEFKQSILKIKNIADMLSAGKESAVINRLQALDLGKTVFKSLLLDADEEYDVKSTALSGLNDLINQINMRIVSASGMPHTILLGTSPTGGLSGKGESENRDFYDKVASQQKTVLSPPLNKFFEMVSSSKDSPVKSEIQYKFNPLWQLDQVEVVKIHKTQAEADNLYILNGTLLPSEVAISRFGAEYSIETHIAPELRKNNVSASVKDE